MATEKRTLLARLTAETGKKYRASFRFAQLSGDTNSAIGLVTKVYCNKKEVATSSNRYLYSFPIIKSTLKNPRYCLDEIQVPNKAGKYEIAIFADLSASPGKFNISDIELTLAPPKLWHRGKYSKLSLNGDIVKGEKIMSSYPKLNTEVKIVKNIPKVFCNGKEEILVPVQAGSCEQILAAKAAGIKTMMVTLPVNNWGRKKGSVWAAKDEYDFSIIDKKLARIAELAPDTKIILLCYDIAYPNFVKDYPEAKWVTETEKSGMNFCSSTPNIAYSLSGKTTQEVCGKFLYELGKHLASTPLGNNIISLHLSAGSDGQWYQPERPWNYKKLDYSNSTRTAVVEEVKKLYKNDINALRKAWNMPNATFENLQTPTKEELAPSHYLLDIKNPQDRRLIEWIHCDQEALINSINNLAGKFKEGFKRKVLVTTYAPVNRFINKTSLFASKNLDGFVYLSSYLRPRSSGGNGGNSYPIASAALHGKLVLEEVDYRNEYFGYDGTNRLALVAMADNDKNYQGQLLRQFGANWSKGCSGWFRPIQSDSYLSWTGFYQKHLSLINNAAKLYCQYQKYENNVDVIVLVGDDYQHHMSRKNNFDHMKNYVSTTFSNLVSNGLNSKIYLLSDLQHPNRAKGKIYIFTGAAYISKSNLDYICQNLQKDGNVLIFANDIGRNSSLGFSESLKKLTGIEAKITTNEMVDGIYLPTDNFLKDIPFMSVWVRNFTTPQIAINPKGTQVIALLPSKLPGAVIKKHKEWTAIYIAGTVKNILSPNFWNKVAKLANVKLKMSPGQVSYFGNSIRLLHGVTDGEKFVISKKKLLDLETGKLVEKEGEKAKFNLNYGETKLLMEIE